MTASKPSVSAGCLLLGVGVLVSGCGAFETATSAASTRPAEAITAQVDDLRARVLGDALVRQALAVDAHLTYVEGMTACMRAAGEDFVAGPLTVPGVPAPTDWTLQASPVSSAWVETYGLGVGGRYATLPWPRPVDPSSVEREVTETFVAAQAECERANPLPDDGGWPESALSLRDDLIAVLEDAADTSAVEGLTAAYLPCMADRGFELDDRSDLVAIVDNRYGSLYYGDGTRDPRATAAWQEAVDAELAAARADADCRREMVALTLPRLDAPLADFAAKHADELTELQTAYAELVERAKARASEAGLDVEWYAPDDELPPLR